MLQDIITPVTDYPFKGNFIFVVIIYMSVLIFFTIVP
jgi:hypothetical protein